MEIKKRKKHGGRPAMYPEKTKVFPTRCPESKIPELKAYILLKLKEWKI